MRRILRPLLAVLAGLTVVRLAGETITLFPAADTAIASIQPANNYGGLTTVPVGTTARSDHRARALLRFDVAASVPAGAQIIRVSLRLRTSKEATGGGADTVGLHRLLVDWGEGTQTTSPHGSVAAPGEATWMDRMAGSQTWAAPGGLPDTDFVPDASASLDWNNPGTYTLESTAILVADVQSWLEAPAGNHGWLLKSAREGIAGTAKRLATRESVESQRPALVIEYTPPPPFEPTLQAPRLTDGQLELRYFLEPGHLYELRASTDLGATPSVVTNHAVKFFGFEARYLDPLIEPRRFYQLVITADID